MSKKLDGSCPKCGKFELETIDYEYVNQTTYVRICECFNCLTSVRESYCLVKSEVVEDD